MIKLEDIYDSIPEQYIISPITEEREGSLEGQRRSTSDSGGPGMSRLMVDDGRKKRGSSGHSFYIGEDLINK